MKQMIFPDLFLAETFAVIIYLLKLFVVTLHVFLLGHRNAFVLNEAIYVMFITFMAYSGF